MKFKKRNNSINESDTQSTDLVNYGKLDKKPNEEWTKPSLFNDDDSENSLACHAKNAHHVDA